MRPKADKYTLILFFGFLLIGGVNEIQKKIFLISKIKQLIKLKMLFKKRKLSKAKIKIKMKI